MTKPTQKMFVVQVKDGKPAFTSPTQRLLFYDFFEKHEGERVWVQLDSKEPTRSTRQNALYWLYLGIIAEDTGYTPHEVHEWVKSMFLTENIKEVFGKKTRVRGSTAKLNKSDFSELLMNIEAETGVPIPDTTPFGMAITHKEYEELQGNE